MSAAGTCFCFAGIARVLKKLRRRHRHVCCRHLLMLCRHRASPKKLGAGIDVSAAGTCLCFAGIAFMWKNRAQAPHPVWGFKNLKERRCRGEGVANATAVRIEGSIVCQTCFQTGVGFSIYSRCSLQSGLALGSSRAKAITGTRQWKNQLQAHAIISNILGLSTGCDDHCTVVVVITDSPKCSLRNTHFLHILK
jgi:hypothetical protein